MFESRIPALVDAYMDARDAVIRRGFGDEIQWQRRLSFEGVREPDFLREGAWVILSAGMRETVIRARFPGISRAFFGWSDSQTILDNREDCREQALEVFNHTRKIDAILTMADQVAELGFDVVQEQLRQDGVSYLEAFPYIGPVTAFHFAKNLGLDVVKPDRHLMRIAAATDFESPLALCEAIAEFVDDRLAVIDLVIWRYATIEPNYVAHFLSGAGDGDADWL